MKIDVLTVLGLVLAVVAVVGGNLLEGGKINSLVQFAALTIVLGGTLAAVLVQTQFRVFTRAMQMVRWIFYPPDDDIEETIRRIAAWSRIARSRGLLALDRAIGTELDSFTRVGLQHVVDGADAVVLRHALELEIHVREESEFEAVRVFESAGGYAPTIGILGAVFGLIHVLENLGTPEDLGPGIAIAFVATVYGVGFANLVLLPIAGKLKAVVRRRMRRLEMILEGLVGISEGINPRLIEHRLRAYEN